MNNNNINTLHLLARFFVIFPREKIKDTSTMFHNKNNEPYMQDFVNGVSLVGLSQAHVNHINATKLPPELFPYGCVATATSYLLLAPAPVSVPSLSGSLFKTRRYIVGDEEEEEVFKMPNNGTVVFYSNRPPPPLVQTGVKPCHTMQVFGVVQTNLVGRFLVLETAYAFDADGSSVNVGCKLSPLIRSVTVVAPGRRGDWPSSPYAPVEQQMDYFLRPAKVQTATENIIFCHFTDLL